MAEAAKVAEMVAAPVEVRVAVATVAVREVAVMVVVRVAEAMAVGSEVVATGVARRR